MLVQLFLMASVVTAGGAATYSLSSIPSCIRPGDLIVVDWSSKVAVTTLDWVGIYAKGRCSNSVGSTCPSGSNAYSFVSISGGINTSNKGVVAIPAPSTEGVYNAFYLPSNLYKIAATTNEFTVSATCAPDYTVAPVNTCYTPGSTINFGWTAVAPGAGSMDWIGIYAAGRCGNGIGKTCPSGSNFWQRLNEASPNSATAGTLSVTIPANALTSPPTTYFGYYLINDLYNIAAVSNAFTVQSDCSGGGPTTPTLSASTTTVVAGGFLTISWTGVSTSDIDDRLMFTASGVPTASNFYADSWQYTYGDNIQKGLHPPASGSVSIKAPATPGTYNVYYCFNNGFNCPASLTITVTAPKVTCRAAGNTASNIKHIITIISENHSFDSYFGRYCQAPYGSNPSCNTGPQCCESYKPVPGLQPTKLDDTQNGNFDPCHSTECEVCEINGGLMDSYTVTGANVTGCPGANNQNFAMADGTKGSADQYWGWAKNYAMSDRFYQSAPGASSQGEMYFARGAFVFKDNNDYPANSKALGLLKACTSNCASFQDPTIGDLLQGCNVDMKFYHVGFQSTFDPTDDAFLYYPSLANGPNAGKIFVPFTQLASDISAGTLPAVSFVKAAYGSSGQTEHPGGGATISAGENFNAGVINQILASPLYKDNTVVFLVPDESGGFRDSMPTPPRSAVDNKPYGPRTPFIAVGNIVNKNYVSHVQTEPASLVRFIESNWFADATPGQLQTRDAVAGSLNDLFDPAKVGFVFP
ncbi:hypothetical protein HDU79_008468 [Rhizoclosmatium sp. JEL0117]|nr:hypothetical protein HDU79_008468 [Rhizoclosmatium sp. JEL0117]